MKKSIQRISLLLALLMVFTALSVALTGCSDPVETTGSGTNADGNNGGNGSQDPDNDNTGDGNGDYAVLVKTAGGMKLSGITVSVYSKKTDKQIGKSISTNASGAISLNLSEDDDYYVTLGNVPEGYAVEQRYDFYGKDCIVTLTSSVIKTGEDGEYPIPGNGGRYYQLGSVMHDFSYTDIDGNTYILSEVLKEKKAVLLNFWYTGCTWCQEEFPAIDRAYLQYSEDVAVLALNNHEKRGYQGDSLADIENFREQSGLNIPVVYDRTLLMDAFIDDPILAPYPLSVMIDRYGVICLLQEGAILGDNAFTSIFRHFAADDYEQKLITTPEDLAPAEKPNISMPSSEEIAAVFNGTPGMNVYYYPETSALLGEYSWPFIIAEKDGVPCIAPSNSKKTSTYSFLHVDLTLKKGDVVAFDHYASTERNVDTLTASINGEDMYTISGITDKGWETCYTYVAQEDGDYQLTFRYVKDYSGNEGEDIVYLKNLRIVSIEDIDIDTYIPRYAASDPTEAGDGYNTYAEIHFNETDGYYHVGSVDGPLLLAYLLGPTYFNAGEASINDYVYTYQLYRDYLETTEDATKATDFYAEKVSGGYQFYRVVKDEKQYLDLYYDSTLKQPAFRYESNLDLVKCVFSYDENAGAWCVMLKNGSTTVGNHYLGAYGNSTLVDAHHLTNTLTKYPDSYFPTFLVDRENNIVTTPEVNTVYRFALKQGNLKDATLYLTGDVKDLAEEITVYSSYSSRSTLNGYCTVNEELRQLLMMAAKKIGYGDAVNPECEWLQVCRYYDAYGPSGTQLEDPIKGLSYQSAFLAKLDDPTTTEVEKNSIYYDGRPLIPRGFLYKFVPTVSGVYNILSDAPSDIESWIYMEHSSEPVYTYEAGLERNWTDPINCSMYMYMEAGTAYYIDIAFHDVYGAGTIDFTLSYVGEEYALLRYCSGGFWTSKDENDMGQTNIITGGLMNFWYDEENDRFYEYYSADGSKLNPTPIYVDFAYISPIMSPSVWNTILNDGCNFAMTQDDETVVKYMRLYGDDYEAELKALWGENYESLIADYDSTGSSSIKTVEEAIAFVQEAASGQYHGMMIDYSKTDKDVTILEYLKLYPETYKDELQELWGEKYDETYVNETVAGNYHGTLFDYAKGQTTAGVDYTAMMQKYLPVCNNPDAPKDEWTWTYPECVITDVNSPLYGCTELNMELAEVLQRLMDKYALAGVPNAWSKLCVYFEQINAETAIRA